MIDSVGAEGAVWKSVRKPMPEAAWRSVGHAAKAAVAAGREAGADLPRNAQGLAASAIARGAEPGSLFAAQIAPVTQPGDATDDVLIGDARETSAPDGETEFGDIPPFSEIVADGSGDQDAPVRTGTQTA